ncbi:MFS transporter [Epilithonimonas xixisoli]|uniref:Fucose permease n=1 Tax=Epilithonimonas xixisoli TaxID=1476462 RepID=A0A4R8IBE6_9FLAO|nr:MFS transporter [Epilithonimonas xixisoli]TDX87004.1 fucose permease [Epilithonimonas xixisoli]
MTSKNQIKLPLMLSFLIFSMLLNSMGAIILQLSSKISYTGLGFLESFKDIPMAVISLFCVNLISKTGNKNALIFSLIFIILSCIALPLVDAFWFFKIWLSIVGVSFALAKISVFSIIKNNYKDKELASTISSVDAAFMFGIFFVNIGFGSLLTSDYAEYWKFGFWIIALFSIATVLMIRPLEIIEIPASEKKIFSGGLKFLLKPKIIYFFIIIFLMVLVEQSFNSWLPSFYKNNLKISTYFALQSSAFLALFSFFGRLITSKLILRFHWFRMILICLFIIFIILGISQILITYFYEDYKYILVFLIPLVGLFLAPLYPLYNSEILNKIPAEKTHYFVSIVVICSSLGSSLGSIYMAMIFYHKMSYFYPIFIFLPLLIIFGLTFVLNKTPITYDRKR